MEQSPEAKTWPTVYVKTSVFSYLAANPSRDVVTRGHQEATRRWWANRARWDLLISSAVLIEVMKGDHAMAIRRMELLEGVTAVPVNTPARVLAGRLLGKGPLPPQARVDAEHIAVAAVNEADFLVTWNLKHIANPAMRKRIDAICRVAGYEPPVICTPDELMES
ncbi:MAG TPA: type II toxin-antitoxin system VapC family toxin [Longimicrobium sp.]|nr:type II toxin-antitoxin system VapC family toxin [Longimicrobium sp.]